MTQHTRASPTPGPWRIQDEHPYTYVDSGKRTPLIARADTEANAAFIVLAANAHAQLLAACQEAYARLDGNIGGLGVTAAQFQRNLELSDMLSAAIAKAQP